jgi:hypothetical protein
MPVNLCPFEEPALPDHLLERGPVHKEVILSVLFAWTWSPGRVGNGFQEPGKTPKYLSAQTGLSGARGTRNNENLRREWLVFP